MSTDYKFACFDCKETSPIFASASISYGFKLWLGDELDDIKKWFGHRQSVGNHEGHDVRFVSEHFELPWSDENDRFE